LIEPARRGTVAPLEVPMGAQLLTGPSLEATDPAVAELIEAEIVRELETICLIPSENYVSRAVLEALESVRGRRSRTRRRSRTD
jgi:hypothetical protein